MEYWGETARSCYLRGAEHCQDLQDLAPTSHMAKHLVEHHPEMNLEDPSRREAKDYFSMSLHKKYNSAMERQLGEAICIARAGGMESGGIMNSKDEYSRCVIPILQTNTENQREQTQKRHREAENELTQKEFKRMKHNPRIESETHAHTGGKEGSKTIRRQKQNTKNDTYAGRQGGQKEEKERPDKIITEPKSATNEVKEDKNYEETTETKKYTQTYMKDQDQSQSQEPSIRDKPLTRNVKQAGKQQAQKQNSDTDRQTDIKKLIAKNSTPERSEVAQHKLLNKPQFKRKKPTHKLSLAPSIKDYFTGVLVKSKDGTEEIIGKRENKLTHTQQEGQADRRRLLKETDNPRTLDNS